MDSWRGADVPRLPGSGPAPRLHDTATGELVPAAASPVATLYACGITPYDATHVGHAATFTAWDLLVRAWLDAESAAGRRFRVVYVQNVTDVDDPLLERAARDREDWRELAGREIRRYRADMEALRILPPTHLVGAVEALPVIEAFNARMAARGALYNVDEDVYFARSADPDFGALSGPGTPSGFSLAEMADLSARRGGDPGRPGKKDPLDCLVWRAERPGEPAWDSRFGRGRPGWHVECAAIATRYLGTAFDVQAGGLDLVFPHHEMSASHARAAFAAGHPGSPGGASPRESQGGQGEQGAGAPRARGRRGASPRESQGGQGEQGAGAPRARERRGASPRENTVFARVYTHAGMVGYRGEKMSKSLGNLVFVHQLLAGGADPMAVRMALLAHHYRCDWEWTDAVLADAGARLARWRSALARAQAVALPEAGAAARPEAGPAAGAAAQPGAGRAGGAEAVLAGVRARLRDDLDAPGALGVVDRWADVLLARSPTRITAAEAAGARLVRNSIDALLGIGL